MKMQDKEFDQLFRSKLDNFETEPSANVWAGITEKLGAGRRKKLWMPFLSIAASIIVLVAAGILFIPQKVKVSKLPVKNSIVKAAAPVKTKVKEAAPAVTPGPAYTVVSPRPLKRPGKAPANNAAAQHITPVIEPVKPVYNSDNQVLVSLLQKKQDIITGVAPDTGTHIALKQQIAQTPASITKPVLLATNLPAENIQEAAPAKTKHRIRNFGDLVNFVVAKVDKRQDKFIEFTDKDDESNITGVNLGIIKIKKEK